MGLGKPRMTLNSRVALLTLSIGFVVEGGTEAYQFATSGALHSGWVGFYYVGIATTIVGFFLMYRGRHEWSAFHRKSVVHGHAVAWMAVALFAGATIAIAAIAAAEGPAHSGGTPVVLVALVGGAVALAFGNFFLGLALLVRHLVSRWGAILSWAAFVWSLAVAVLTGVVVGQEFPTLLGTFFSSPLALMTSVAPLTFTMAPLFVTYGLFAAAYMDAERRMRRSSPDGEKDLPEQGRTSPPEAPVPAEKTAGSPAPAQLESSTP